MSKEIDSAKYICQLLQDNGFDAVFVGGCVRDTICGKQCNDIDIATSAKSSDVMTVMLKNGIKSKIVGEAFSVCIARHESYEFEIASFRKDIGGDGRHPTSIEFASMEEDSKRRDFTINAVFYDPIKKEYYDFVGGIKDITDRKLRFVGDPKERLKEDYLRALRFIRFWAKGFTPDDKTVEIVNDLSPNISYFVARDRISKEIMEKLFYSIDEVSFVFSIMSKRLPKLLETLFPEVYATIGVPQNPKYHPEGDVFTHTMRIVQHLAFLGSNKEIILAGLYHDVGKAVTTIETNGGDITSRGHEKASVDLAMKYMEKNRFPNKTIDYVCGLIGDHMKLHYKGMKVSTLRKLIAKPYFDDLIIHAYADCMASDGDISILEEYSETIREIKNRDGIVLPAPLITGKTLIDIGFKPSPIFKEALEEAYNLQLEGVFSSLEEGIEIVKRRLK